MISFLVGKVEKKEHDCLHLNVNGIGYQVFVPLNTLSQLPAQGEHASVYTYLHVREDILQLYGFMSLDEKKLFEKIITVSGIGPKVACSILSVFGAVSLKRAIVHEDVSAITSVPGIGKKHAQRLVLELKEKLDVAELEVISDPAVDSPYAEARSALRSLGYSAQEAAAALQKAKGVDGDLSAEDMIKVALKNLVKK